MILNDAEIRKRCDTRGLIIPCSNEHLRHCGYTLSVGSVFIPETGERFAFSKTNGANQILAYDLKPSETVVVMTKESVRIPNDLMASFGAINRRASDGVMLINGSIVEPGYSGPLSCHLVNFSSQNVSLAEGDPIGKLWFHQLMAEPAELTTQSQTLKAYSTQLCQKAQKYPRTFVSIASKLEEAQKIKDDAVEEATRAVVGQLRGGLLILAVLLLFSTLQPKINAMIWGDALHNRAVDSERRLEELLETKIDPIAKLEIRLKEIEAKLASFQENKSGTE